MSEKHERRAGAHPHRDDAVGMKSGHHIGPDAAAGVSPQNPGDGHQFRMPRLGGEIVEGLEEGLFRAAARIEPEFRASRRDVGFFVQHVITGAEQGAVPFLRQRLPVQVIGGGGAFLGGRGAGAVLVDDDAAKRLHAVGNPERVGDAHLQFVRGGRGGIFNRGVLSGSVCCSGEGQHAKDARQRRCDESARPRVSAIPGACLFLREWPTSSGTGDLFSYRWRRRCLVWSAAARRRFGSFFGSGIQSPQRKIQSGVEPPHSKLKNTSLVLAQGRCVLNSHQNNSRTGLPCTM